MCACSVCACMRVCVCVRVRAYVRGIMAEWMCVHVSTQWFATLDAPGLCSSVRVYIHTYVYVFAAMSTECPLLMRKCIVS